MNATTPKGNDMTVDGSGEKAPHVGGIRFGPALAAVLYLMLVGSAALALTARNFPQGLPKHLAQVAPWLFLCFTLCFAVYRFVLVQAKKYPAFKAFFQVGSAAVFFMLLLPAGKAPFRGAEDPLSRMLAHPSAEVRALAAEVVRYRPDGRSRLSALVQALSDPDPQVRGEAHRSLVKLVGEDLGPPESSEARRAWETKVR